jgi:dTDP-4-amino-4,6-dideoxygalactose transaminase
MKHLFERTLPPAAAPIPFEVIAKAIPAIIGKSSLKCPFEDEIRQKIGQRYCLFVSSGKAALVLILRALKNIFPERDEVIIPAFTCFSVPAAIKKAGLKIKLCDTGKNSLDLAQSHLQSIVESNRSKRKILCVIATHLFGCPADLVGIKGIIGNDIPIVEDAAQCFGGEWGTKKLGTLSDVGFFSLGRGKALSTMDGGIIVTNRDDIGTDLVDYCNKFHKSPNFGSIRIGGKTVATSLLQHPSIFWLPKAIPILKLGETLYEKDFPIRDLTLFQKELGQNWQTRLDKHQNHRKENCRFLLDRIPHHLNRIKLGQDPLPLVRFPFLSRSISIRNSILKKSEETGCGIMPSYPSPVNKIQQIRNDFEGQTFPNAQDLSDCLITFPVHEYLNKKDRTKIFKIILSLNPIDKDSR